MKICLLGPVVSSRKVGGVATFVESLAKGFSLLGHNVLILTNYKENNDIGSGVSIVSLGGGNPILFLCKAYIFLVNNKQDLIIGSTWYDLVTLLPMVHGVKFHYLHGFGVPLEGVAKAIMISINDKFHRYNGYLISNSYFTKMINEVIYVNKVDKVVPIGVSTDFLEINTDETRIYDLVFVGRIVYNKGIDIIAKSIIEYERRFRRKLNVAIVGDGPYLSLVKKILSSDRYKVKYTGFVNQKQTIEYYKKSKIFISLDPREPYGQTFIEARISGCKIICPTSGGQIEYLNSDNESVCYVEYDNVEQIVSAINSLLKKDMDNKTVYSDVYNKHSYKAVASNLINYYQQIKAKGV